MSGRPAIRAFFDEATNTFSYLVADPATRRAAVIDPVLDYDPRSGEVDTRSVEAILAAAAEKATDDRMVARDPRPRRPLVRLALCEGEDRRQDRHRREHQGGAAHFPAGVQRHRPEDGRQRLRSPVQGRRAVRDRRLEVEVIHTPGHTPACISYRIEDAVFVGDTLFMPDYGTARADFPGGDAHQLYRSIRKLMALPPETRLFMCHDYKAPGRDSYAWETTVGEQRSRNVHVHEGVGEEEFVAMRNARDATLSAPTLLLPSIQVNIRAGRFPAAEANGVRYLKIPVKFRNGAQAAA